MAKPRVAKNFTAAASGIVGDAKYVYELDVTGDFETKKSTFFYKCLKNLGFGNYLLMEIRYGNRMMTYRREDYGNEDYLNVLFL